MSDIAGKTVLITGSTDGIGKRTAHDLAAMGATVLMHGRNAEKGAVAMEEIAESTGNDRLRYYNADLSSLDDVCWLASRLEGDDIDVYQQRWHRYGAPGRKELSHDGHELRLAATWAASSPTSCCPTCAAQSLRG